MQGLTIHKLADKTGGRRHDQHGQPLEAWPAAGVEFVGDSPKKARVPVSVVEQGRSEGWISIEDEEFVVRPAGPHHDPWRGDRYGRNHTFRHGTALVFHMVDGDHRYRIAANPDKQHPNRPDKAGAVAHYYDIELGK